MAFTYPIFFFCLLALAIPLAIHLFELRRPKRVLFTNVGFIRQVSLVTARQRKLKHLLVLLARLGFLFFLVLLFVQPYIPAPVENSKDQSVVGVFVDTTPSMQAAGADEQSLFEQAVQQARDLPTAYLKSTQFSFPSARRQLLSVSAYNSTLDELRISGQGRQIGDNLGRLGGANNNVKQVYVLSDFQRSAFSARSIEQVDSAQQIFLVPLSSKRVQNVFVDSVWLDDAFVRSNTDIVLRVKLRNGGDVAVENCQAKLFVGKKQVAAFTATVPLQGATTVTVRVRVTEKDLVQCKIQLEDYPVTFDNAFYFVLQPSSKIRVLDVAASENPSTQELYANEPLFSYSLSKQGGLDYRVVEDANLVVVQGQSRIDTDLRENLRRVVQRGGSVVLVPPTQSAGRASYNQLFRELGVGPVQWETAGGSPVLRNIAVPNSQNPFFKDVFGAQTRQPVMPKASPVLRWSRSGTDILRMRDGDGFLAAFPSGKGMVYVFASPFDAAYSDFTQQALFVPVMYQLAMRSQQRQQQPAYRLNQGTIAVNVTADTDAAGKEQVFKLTKDSLTLIPNQRVQAGILRFDVPPGMSEPGFYELTHNGRVVSTLAFNFDKHESELATYSAAELRQMIGPNRPNVQVYETSMGESVAAKYKAERVGTPLWHYCLWAALACLLAEVLLLRFVRQTKAVEPHAVAA